jgi:energy-coupling factor transport system permease protein
VSAYLAARLARIPRGWLARNLAPLAPLLILTWALNAVRVGAAAAPEAIAALGPFAIVRDGAVAGGLIALRIAVMVAGTALLALTTSPRLLSDALAFFARPLELVRVPVDDLAMMMTIALRFMPTLAEELAGVVRARVARGADFEGSLWARARSWSTVLVPLFVGLFRRADELAVAMEARGYGSHKRSRLHPLALRPVDVAIGLAGAAWVGAILVVDRLAATGRLGG